VQPDGIPVLVHELDSIDAVRSPGRAANLVHQLQQHSGIDLRREPMGMRHPEMQYHESLEGQPHEYCDAEQPVIVRYCKQRLNAGDLPDANAQRSFMLANLGDTIRLDRVLDAHSDAMLIYVEEKQLLEGCALIQRQLTFDID
jgi:hypothetical protein